MSRIGFVLLTHNNPPQLLRLVQRLNSMFGNPPIVCHHDFGKCPLPGGFLPPNVEFVRPHVKTKWGDFSLVEAMLRSLEQMYRRTDAPDWCMTLSGSCYPTKPAAQILENLEAGGYDAHFEVKDLGRNALVTDLHKQYYKRYCVKKLPFPSVNRRLRPVIRPLNIPHVIGRHLLPFGDALHPYAGSQWFTVSRHAASTIFEFLKTPIAAALTRHYRGLTYADESYFQIIVCNSPSLNVRHDNLMYIDWSAREVHPKLLTLVDLEAITASPTHFARKFALDASADALDALDRIIDSGDRIIDSDEAEDHSALENRVGASEPRRALTGTL